MKNLIDRICCDYSFVNHVSSNEKSTIIYLQDESLLPKVPDKFRGIILIYKEEEDKLEFLTPVCGKLKREFKLLFSLNNLSKNMNDYLTEDETIELIKKSIDLLKNTLSEIRKNKVPELPYKGIQNDDRFNVKAKDINFYNIQSKINDDDLKIPIVPSVSLFTFWTVYTNPYLLMPVKKRSGNNFVLPLASIDTLNAESFYLPPKFIATGTEGRTINKFKYVGDTPLHGVLSGNLRLLIRLIDSRNQVINENAIIPPMSWLILRSVEDIEFEATPQMGLTNSNVFSKPNYTVLSTRQLGKVDAWKFNPLPSYSDCLEFVSSSESLVTEIEYGSISKNWTNEFLNLEGLEEHRTTNWIDTKFCRFFIAKTNGTSTVMRVQWKDKFGNIHYDAELSGNPKDSNTIFEIHPNAVSFRIYFSNKYGGSTATDIDIWELPKEINPYYGLWAVVDFNICTDVNFFKDKNYFFELRLFSGESIALPDEYGVIVENGGLYIDTNSTLENQRYLKRILNDN